MEQLAELVQSLNPVLVIPGLALIVFLVVKILHKLGFLKDGNMQRIGVIVGTFLTTELIAEAEQAITSVLVGLVSVCINEFAKWVGKQVRGE